MIHRPRRWRLLERCLDWQISTLARAYGGLWHRCKRHGSADPFQAGSALVIANHRSHADAMFLIAASGRRIHFFQAREQYEIFLVRHFFRLIGCIPISRGRPDPGAIRLALRRMEQGAVVGIFPEGEVVRAGEKLKPGRTGAALLALRSAVPVIPAYIEGSKARGILVDWIWPAGGVRVRFGSPICLAAYRDQPITRARLHEVTDLLMQRIEELRPAGGLAANSSLPN